MKSRNFKKISLRLVDYSYFKFPDFIYFHVSVHFSSFQRT